MSIFVTKPDGVRRIGQGTDEESCKAQGVKKRQTTE